MKKIFTQVLMTFAIVAGVFVAQAQNATTINHAEAVGSGNTPMVPMPGTQALIDHQFTLDITATTGSLGNAGIVHMGTGFWVAKWASDTVWVLDNTGALISSFNIPLGVGGGIRALTTDGTSVYAAQNGPEIVVIDVPTLSVAGSIALPTLGFNVRSVTYDPTADGGAGGFWVSNFATDIVQISMTGTVLNTILATSHGLAGMYGTAFDNITDPASNSLWVFNQPGNPGAELWQIDITTGNTTGITVDVNASLGYAGLAGGVCVAVGIQGQPSLCGLIQQTPNSIEGFELTLPVGLNENSDNMNVGVFPIPANDFIHFVINDMNSASLNVEVYDVNGSLVKAFTSNEKKITLATSGFAAGMYTVKISDGAAVTAKKFMVK
ncbi:MAG: T9SS type A sorting domain-containing protein [Bacteroidetes bacterium]|nr:T9SS type A sorting domain-containing protein [Bacteroidota bacterium]